MKKLLLLSVLLMGSGITFAQKEHCSWQEKDKKEHCCAPILICQKNINKVTKSFTITKSGSYAFAEDITGQIVVDADDVCIDLCCKRLNGNIANDGAIVGHNHRNLLVHNGFIENSNGTGIFLAEYESPVFEHLSFYPVNEAIVVFDSHQGVLSNIKANDNTTTSGVMIIIQPSSFTSDNFVLSDVEVSHNVVNRTAQSTFSLLDISGSSNVQLTRWYVNNNSCIDDQTFVPFSAVGSDNISAEDGEVNENSAVQGSGIASMAAAIFAAGGNYVIRNCRFNFSQAQERPLLIGLAASSIGGLIVDNCQANGTALLNSATSVQPLTIAAGMIITDDFGLQLTNSQAHGTFLEGAVNTNSYILAGFLLGFQTGLTGQVVGCQAHDGQLVGVDPQSPATLAAGFYSVAQDLLIHDSESKGTFSEGIRAYGFLNVGNGLQLTRVGASGVTADKFAIGIGSVGMTNISIADAVVHENGYGIALEATTNGIVTSSQVYNNGKAGILLFPSILPPGSADNTLIEITNNRVLGNGKGIVYDKTIKNSCVVTRDNVVMGSDEAGYEQCGVDFSGDFEGNFGACNCPDFSVEKPIQLFVINDEADYKHKSGDERLVEFTNVSLCKKK